MKKAKLLLCVICAFIFTSKAQTPYNDTLNLTGNVSSGTNTNTPTNDNAGYIFSNQQIGGNANITYLAGEEIHLTDNFVADPSQDFDARIKKVDVADMSKNNHPWNPKKYERFEIGVQVLPDIQGQINAFLSTGTAGAGKLNPYDPEQVKIKAEFKHSSTTYVRYGFYYKEFKQQANYLDWDTVLPSPYTFRVRLAPPATGAWTFTMHLIVNNTDISQFRGSFNVQNGNDNDGFLTIDNNLKRFKFQESGNVFFGIGQDIADADSMLRFSSTFPNNFVSNPNSYNQQRRYIKDLADNHGNFVRIRINDPWSNPIETNDVHYFPNSDNNNLTLTLLQSLNNYDHNQRHLWEFDSTLALCENRGLYIMLNLLDDQYFYMNNNGTPGWHDNPYYAYTQLNSSNNTDAISFNAFFTQGAINYYKKLLFYVQARWGYSPHIALWEHVNETAHLANELYTNDVYFRTNVNNWLCTMKSYMETGDNGQVIYPRHPQTTGFPDGYSPSCMDVYSENSYFNIQGANIARNGWAETHWYNNQSFLFGEVGFDPECGYVDVSSDVEFHNAVWAGTFSGALTTPLYWNDWHQHYIPHRQNFIGLKAFSNLIDFNQVLYPTNSSGGLVYNFQLCNNFPGGAFNNNISKVYGWAQNSSHYWNSDVSVMDTIEAVYNQYQYAFSHNISPLPRKYCDTSNYPPPFSAQPCYSGFVSTIGFHHLQNGSYQINYYNTLTGAQIGSDYGTPYGGQLNFGYSFDCGANSDVAYILTKLPQRNALSEITDTLYVKADDTAKFIPTHITPDMSRKNSVVAMKNQIKVYPNPARDFVRIVNESGMPIDKIKLFNLVGDELPVILNSNQSIDISQLAAGAYLLHINCNNYESVFKIIKVY